MLAISGVDHPPLCRIRFFGGKQKDLVSIWRFRIVYKWWSAGLTNVLWKSEQGYGWKKYIASTPAIRGRVTLFISPARCSIEMTRKGSPQFILHIHLFAAPTNFIPMWLTTYVAAEQGYNKRGLSNCFEYLWRFRTITSMASFLLDLLRSEDNRWQEWKFQCLSAGWIRADVFEFCWTSQDII